MSCRVHGLFWATVALAAIVSSIARAAEEPRGDAEEHRLTLPCGASFGESDFDLLSRVKGSAGQLLRTALTKPLRNQTEHAALMGYQGSCVVYGMHQDKPKGLAVQFWPDKDPFTCYQNALMDRQQRIADLNDRRIAPDANSGTGPQQQTGDSSRSVSNRYSRSGPAGQSGTGAGSARLDPVKVWDDVGVRCVASYGDHAVPDRFFASWDERGRKQFFSFPGTEKSQTFFFLFDRDELRTVVEADKQGVAAVHLIKDWKIDKTFNSREDAEADADGAVRLRQFNDFQAQVRAGGKEFCDAHKKAWNKRMAHKVNAANAAAVLDYNLAQEARSRMIDNVRQAVHDAPASRTVLWHPLNDYLPVVIQ